MPVREVVAGVATGLTGAIVARAAVDLTGVAGAIVGAATADRAIPVGHRSGVISRIALRASIAILTTDRPGSIATITAETGSTATTIGAIASSVTTTGATGSSAETAGTSDRATPVAPIATASRNDE